MGMPGAIGPVGGQGVETIGDGEDARVKRDSISGEAVGVSLAVHPLVMPSGDGHGFGKTGDGLKDAHANVDVITHDVHFLGGEFAGLIEDFGGNSNLADVMQEAAAAHDVELPGEEGP
jgi:hypothetical protein